MLPLQQGYSQASVSLHTEGKHLWFSGKFDQAIAKYKAAQAEYAVQKNWPEWLRCQSDIATCLIVLAKYEVAADSINHGIKIFDKKLKTSKGCLEPLHTLRATHASLLAFTGKYEEAYKVFSAMLPVVLNDCPDANGLQARILRGMGFAKFNLGEYLTAEIHCHDAIKLLGANGDPELMTAIFAYMTLGEIKEKLFNFEGALVCYQKIEQLEKTAPVTKLFSTSFLDGALGRAYQGLGDYGMALEYSQRSLAVIKGIFGSKNLNTINGVTRVADIYRLRKEFSTALQHYGTALRHLDSLFKNPHEGRAVVLSNMAECHAGMGQWVPAVQAWHHAINEAERLDQKWYLPTVRESLAKFYLKNGNPAEAIKQLLQAEAQLEPHKTNRFADLSRIKALISKAHIQRRDHSAALAKIQESLQLQCRQGIKLDGLANPPEGQLVLSDNIILALSIKADAIYSQWHTDGGGADMLRNVLQTCQYAIQIGERFRRQYQRSADENYEWVKQYHALFVRGVAAAHQLYQHTKDPAYQLQGFALADRNKALLLSEGLQNMDAKAFAGVPQDLLDQEKTLVDEITFHEHKVAEALETGIVSASAEEHSAALFEKKQALQTLIATMERDFPYYYEQKYRPRLVSAREVQAGLDDKTLFIEYLMDPDNQQVYIFTISKAEGLTLVAQTMPDGTLDQVKNFNTLLQSVYLPRDDKRKQFVQLSHRLYRTLLAPIAAQLAAKEKIILVADGMLHYLPFEILVEEAVDAPYHALPYLLRKVEISYQYSGSLWIRHITQRNIQPQVGLLAFAPTFTGVGAGTNDNAIRGGLQPGKGPESFSALPYAQSEVKDIAQLFKEQVVTLLLGQTATENSFKTALERPYRIVHVASHSFADIRQPKFSGIACTAERNDLSPNEYILYADELYNLRIQADLVVLSSCESGFGQVTGSEGLLGLNRGFIYAGASNIIFSLWNASDQGSSDFMVNFYREVLLGKEYSTALRMAKLKMLDNAATASPGIWGGFLLLGR